MRRFSPVRWLRATRPRQTDYRRLLGWAAAIGLLGGGIAIGYYYLLQGGLHLVWALGRPALSRMLAGLGLPDCPTWAVTGLGGLLVGLSLRWLGVPGEIAAVVDNIHMAHGRIDARQTPSMAVTSFFSIVFGGSAGPEAPLVQIVGSVGSWLGDRLRLPGERVRMLTFCGMAAALGAFFGAPLGGALFALEIPHRRGLEYYEALLPAVLAALVSFVVFHAATGFDGPLYRFAALPTVSLVTMVEGAGMGLIGGLIALLFVWLFARVEHLTARLQRRPVLLATLGGIVIGLIADLMPDDLPVSTLFWGEFQLRTLLDGQAALLARHGLWMAVGMLLLLAVAKMIAVGCTLHSGFRGGFIFPLFFIGGTVGIALSLSTGGAVSLPVAALGLMAAVNVAVTKTPISTTVILTTLSGSALMPVIAVASLVSFVATTRLELIRTQRSRTFQPSLPPGRTDESRAVRLSS